jgi:hypothetical protein
MIYLLLSISFGNNILWRVQIIVGNFFYCNLLNSKSPSIYSGHEGTERAEGT